MPDLPRLYSLKQAAALLSPDGRLTAKSLRTMALQGKLHLLRIAGKDFVTAEEVARMVAAAKITLTSDQSCRAADSQQGSIFVPPEMTVPPHGLSEKVRKRRARAQAEMTLRGQSERSKATLSATTNRPKGQVVSIKSSFRK